MAVESTIGNVPHLNPEEFSAAIADHGVSALWRKARACPCRDSRSGQPNILCETCDNGIIWDAGTLVTVLAPGRQRGEVYDIVGLYMNGMVMFTFPHTFTPSRWDRLDLQDAEMVVNNEVFTKGLETPSGNSREALRIAPILSVENVDVWDEANHVAVAKTVGTDLDIDLDTGAITWNDGTPDGTRYSVGRYVARPAFVVMSPQSRDEGHNKQPYRALCQRLDFFRPGVA